MSEEKQENVIIETPTALIAQVDKKPVKLADILEDYVPTGDKVAPGDIVGKSFTIIRARRFASKFPGQSHAYFVVGYLDEEKRLVNTVFGGAAVVELMDTLIERGFDAPLTVTLIENEGGQFGRYYTLE